MYIGKSSCTFRDSFQPLEVSGEWAVPPDSDNLVCVSDEGDALFELYDFRFFPEFTSVVARGRMLDSRYSNRDFEWHLSDARHRDD
ncbi:MAG TPA: hypothetical protein VK034_02755 [Enhygromyxa sp.]|nr:hypothetical protein [Enhygromyxa sp.]